MKNVSGMQRANAGFTLVELMVVLVILAIVVSIAATTFKGAGKDGERSRIISEMSALNDAMGRYFQGNYSYTGADDMDVLRGVGGGTAIAESPEYVVTATVSPDGQQYEIIARPRAGGQMEGEGAYSVNERGQRCSYPGDDGAMPDRAVDCANKW